MTVEETQIGKLNCAHFLNKLVNLCPYLVFSFLGQWQTFFEEDKYLVPSKTIGDMGQNILLGPPPNVKALAFEVFVQRQSH